jgi:hypothetical protein
LQIIAAIEDPPVIAKILGTFTCLPAHRPDHPRAKSICSKRPERTLELRELRLG